MSREQQMRNAIEAQTRLPKLKNHDDDVRFINIKEPDGLAYAIAIDKIIAISFLAEGKIIINLLGHQNSNFICNANELYADSVATLESLGVKFDKS